MRYFTWTGDNHKKKYWITEVTKITLRYNMSTGENTAIELNLYRQYIKQGVWREVSFCYYYKQLYEVASRGE